MNKFEVRDQLKRIREARREWEIARKRFDAEVEYMMKRLILEAARNYISAHEISNWSGFTIKRVRLLMRAGGLNPRAYKTLLDKDAADILRDNAELMGVDPHEIDLMSPLAYLPAGDRMRRDMNAGATTSVTELPEMNEYSQFPETVLAPLVQVFKQAWHKADGAGQSGHRVEAGIIAVLNELGYEADEHTHKNKGKDVILTTMTELRCEACAHWCLHSCGEEDDL